MASFTTKLGAAIARTPKSRIVSRQIQVRSLQGAKDAPGPVEARNAGEQVPGQTNDMYPTAQESEGERAKQTAQDSWGSAKNTAQKAADTVMGKAEDSKEFLKDNAEQVKNSMNTEGSTNN